MKNSPYLDKPVRPLAVMLPRTLEKIESELADVKVNAVEKRRLRRRAELMRGLLSGKGSWKPAPIRRDWRRLCLALIRRAMVEVAGLIRLTQPRSSTGE
jgi:hypothetical protein